MTFRVVMALLIACLQGCGPTNDGSDVVPGERTSEAAAEGTDPFEVNEVWRDSCRRWCGVQHVLDGDCAKGEAVLRGVPLGTKPFPEEPPKSYDVGCIEECLVSRGGTRACWRQETEANDCLAQQAVFVCVKAGEWDVYGCESAGEDPALCAEWMDSGE